MTYGKIFYSLFFATLLSLLLWQVNFWLMLISPFFYWFLYVNAEAFTHSIFVNEGIDVTPKGMKWGRRLVVVTPRLLIGWLTWFVYGAPFFSWYFVLFFFGCLFIHLLWFGPMLNKLTGKKLDHLDTGYTDKFLHWITWGFFPARVFMLIVLASGCIALFYAL